MHSHQHAPAIAVESLVKRYKNAKRNAVDGISFEVQEGEFFAFLGPNGAGKTTTISIVTTTLAPTSGTVKIAGYDLEKHPEKVRRNIGVIFQNPSLDGNLTTEENIRLHCALYGLYPFMPTYSMMPKAYRHRIEELTEVVSLRGEMFKLVKTFSGGMKRKLEIIRSLIHKPKILFLDEPTSGLDPVSRKGLWEYLRHVRETERTTIFLTTHYLDEAEDADRVSIVDHGKIILSGTPAFIKKKLLDEVLEMDAEDRDALMRELEQMGVPFETKNHLRVILPEAQSAQRIIQKIKTPLTHLDMSRPTLEEAYIHLIGQHAA